MKQYTTKEIEALTSRDFIWEPYENRWTRDFSELPEMVYKVSSTEFMLIEHHYNHQIHDYQRSVLTFNSIPNLLAHLL